MQELQDAYKWLIENKAHVMKLAFRSCKGAFHLLPDLWDVAVDRTPRAFELFDEAFDIPLNAYVMNSLAWYFFKWVNANQRRMAREEQLEDIEEFDIEDCSTSFNLEAFETVQYILGRLDEYDRQIIFLYHFGNNTFEELGSIIGISKQLARLHYYKALKKAKGLANVDEGKGV